MRDDQGNDLELWEVYDRKGRPFIAMAARLAEKGYVNSARMLVKRDRHTGAVFIEVNVDVNAGEGR